jgi:hypothetical protein
MNRRERLLGVLYAMPRDSEIDRRKERFRDIAAFISQRGGWTTSVPGAHEVSFDALIGSPLPDQLRALGWIVEKIGTTERILPQAVQHRFEIAPDGTLVPPTEGSTKPVTVTNAGIATVEQFGLQMPYQRAP